MSSNTTSSTNNPTTTNKAITYGEAIREGFAYLLKNHDDVFTIGQGLWSPWYVGSSMTDLDKEFGRARVIDTPVSEAATTGVAIGASLSGKRPIVIHPRMDFMILATDPIINQAAKWSHMLGGQAHPAVTIRGIINRGGQQGAQHSQALHSMFAHVPGLRVVMPATVLDARNLLVAATLCDDPVLYIDDRWLYDQTDELPAVDPQPLENVQPQVLREGNDISLVACGYSVLQCREVAEELEKSGISAEVVDLRQLNPLHYENIIKSVAKTGRLLAVDGGWTNCGMAAEIVCGVSERVDLDVWKTRPQRITLTDSAAPTSGPLEEDYYTSNEQIVAKVKEMVRR